MEKKRCKAMVMDIIAPCIEEMIHAVEETYGSEAVNALEKIIAEANS